MSNCQSIPLTPRLDLAGKAALVTGASKGLGFAAAAALASAGAEVYLVARNAIEVEAASQALRDRGDKARAVSLDITDLAAMRRAVEVTSSFDILINNAGTNRPAPFLETDIEDFDAIFDLNIRSSYFVAQAVARKMVAARKGGTIVNVSSQMGHVGAANRSVYCASKHALEGMTKSLGIELAQYGIRVNSICPTFVETPLTSAFLREPEFHAEVLSKIKLGRLGTPEDIMGAIVFLCSDAASLITGSSLMIDGGWTAE